MDYLNKSSTNLIRIRSDRQPSKDTPWAWEGFGDWLAQDGSGNTFGATPKDLIGTAFYAYCATLMAKIAKVLGKPDDASMKICTNQYALPSLGDLSPRMDW
jgi:alpha-L-rhamnosidase